MNPLTTKCSLKVFPDLIQRTQNQRLCTKQWWLPHSYDTRKLYLQQSSNISSSALDMWPGTNPLSKNILWGTLEGSWCHGGQRKNCLTNVSDWTGPLYRTYLLLPKIGWSGGPYQLPCQSPLRQMPIKGQMTEDWAFLSSKHQSWFYQKIKGYCQKPTK